MASLTDYIIFSSIYPGCDLDDSGFEYSNSLTSVSISEHNEVTVSNQVAYNYCDVGTDFFNDVLNNQTVTNEIDYCVTNQQNSYISTMHIPVNYEHILQQIFESMSTSFKIVPLKFGSFIVTPNVIVHSNDGSYLDLQIAMADNVSESVIRKTFDIRITRSGDTYSGTCDGFVEYICNIPIQ